MTSVRFSLTRSVGGMVLLTLVCVNTLLLTLFGVIDLLGEKNRLESELRYDLEVIADQLAANLNEPLWYMEQEHVARLLDGIMQNERVAAVVVTEKETGTLFAGRARDRGWRSSPVVGAPAMDQVLRLKRDIVYTDKVIGTVEVALTRRFATQDLQKTITRTALRILGLNVALALVLLVVLRRQIIVPLARLERYAAKVSLGEDERGEDLSGLRGELKSLASTVEEMVQRISAAQRKYQDIFEHATEGIVQSTLDGRILSANAALAHMAGYDSPEEFTETIVDASRQLYQDPQDRQRILQKLLAENTVANFQVRFVRRNRQTIWVLLNFRLVRDPAAMPLYLEGTVIDVTARVRAERRLEIFNRHLREAVKERTRRLAEKATELEAANLRLQELDRLKSGFLATVSHDLRTPLTSIMGFAKLISRDFAKHFVPFAAGHDRLARQATRITANLDIIESEGERLTRLINDFLDLSKIESGQAQWRDSLVDPAVILRHVADAISADFVSNANVVFDMEIAPDLPLLFIDADRLTQVLVNLLGNAAKFTDEGSVRLRASVDGQVLRVAVTDTGQGVPRESLEKIFDKFHQAQAGDTVADGQRRKGTGLGLAICRQIVEHYQGRIWAESELGRGSTFIMELPLSHPLPQKESAGPQPRL